MTSYLPCFLSRKCDEIAPGTLPFGFLIVPGIPIENHGLSFHYPFLSVPPPYYYSIRGPFLVPDLLFTIARCPSCPRKLPEKDLFNECGSHWLHAHHDPFFFFPKRLPGFVQRTFWFSANKPFFDHYAFGLAHSLPGNLPTEEHNPPLIGAPPALHLDSPFHSWLRGGRHLRGLLPCPLLFPLPIPFVPRVTQKLRADFFGARVLCFALFPI